MTDYPPLSINTLTVKEKAYVGALLHTSLLKREIAIDLTKGISSELAPTAEYRERIIIGLLKKKVLLPFKRTHKRYFSSYGYYQYENILYKINIEDIEDLLSSFMYPAKVMPEDKQEALSLLMEIRLHEALEYMQDTLQKFHLRVFRLDPRYTQLFLQILKSYSLGQLFNFIYTAVRDQAAYMQRDAHTYVPLENYIYKKIIDRFERAEVKGWNIIHFDRAWGWQ